MEKLFKLTQNNTNIKTEILAGVTTFFAMCYIVFVNPRVLSETGMDAGAVMVATCISAALGTLLMGLLANYPFALAPGMGLNAFFAYTICGTMGYSWQAALSAVFISGIFFVIITVTKLRGMILDAIALPLKRAIGAGIGLFITLIGLTNAGIIASPPGGSPVIGLGDLGSPTVMLTVFGLILSIALICRNVRFGLLIGIIITSAVGAAAQFGFGAELGITRPEWGAGLSSSFKSFGGMFGQCFSGFNELFDTGEGFGSMLAGVLSIFIALTLTDMFDTMGFLIGTAEKAGFLSKDGTLPRADRAMLSDAIATSAGAVLGTSTVTTYIESTAGINVGGRTGLTSVVTGLLFLAAVFLSPLLGLVPTAATAPVLILIGVMMVSSLKSIDWDDLTEALPCFATVAMMPFAYSIADGIGLGFIFYVLIHLFSGKFDKIHPILAVFAFIFVIRYTLMAAGLL